MWVIYNYIYTYIHQSMCVFVEGCERIINNHVFQRKKTCRSVGGERTHNIPTIFIFRGCNPYIEGLKPSCFMGFGVQRKILLYEFRSSKSATKMLQTSQRLCESPGAFVSK